VAPDGQRIVVLSNKEGPNNVFWQRADGSGSLERLTTSQDLQVPSSWSPGGQALAFLQVIGSVTGLDVRVLRTARPSRSFKPRSGKPPPFSHPMGYWLAYVSDESGRYEIYVQPYPGPGGKYQISTDGGTEPVWNHKGGELF
jgi:Tol biopolymer transport system component